MTARLVALAALFLGGCPPHPSAGPPRWEAYADKGAFPVRGAPRSDPGATILRALQREPSVGRILAARGEPDTLQIVTVRERSWRVILTYGLDQDGPPRRIVLELPSAERTPGRAGSSTRRVRPTVSAGGDHRQPMPAPDGTPTALQGLECPIDPGRPDCRALCAGSGAHEWCR